MTRDDLFTINAGIVKALCEGVAKTCPKVRSRISDANDRNCVTDVQRSFFSAIVDCAQSDCIRAHTYGQKERNAMCTPFIPPRYTTSSKLFLCA